jgi:hypothetical protein
MSRAPVSRAGKAERRDASPILLILSRAPESRAGSAPNTIVPSLEARAAHPELDVVSSDSHQFPSVRQQRSGSGSKLTGMVAINPGNSIFHDDVLADGPFDVSILVAEKFMSWLSNFRVRSCTPLCQGLFPDERTHDEGFPIGNTPEGPGLVTPGPIAIRQEICTD